MSPIASRLALWVLFVGMTGCQKSEPPATTGEKRESLVHAEVDTDDNYVGVINGYCTATLIGRKTVLTAAICVSEGQRVQFCTYPNAQVGSFPALCTLGTVHNYPGYSGPDDLDHD